MFRMLRFVDPQYDWVFGNVQDAQICGSTIWLGIQQCSGCSDSWIHNMVGYSAMFRMLRFVDPQYDWVFSKVQDHVVDSNHTLIGIQQLSGWYLFAPRNFKGEMGLILTRVNAMVRWQDHKPITYGGELLYLRIWRDLHTLSLPRDSPHDNQYACVIWVHAGKATHA